MLTPPLDLRNSGIEEIEYSPLHLNWLIMSLRLRRKLMRVRKQVTIFGVIHWPREHVRAIIRVSDLVEADFAQIHALAYSTWWQNGLPQRSGAASP
jgi:hypothetical protein